MGSVVGGPLEKLAQQGKEILPPHLRKVLETQNADNPNTLNAEYLAQSVARVSTTDQSKLTKAEIEFYEEVKKNFISVAQKELGKKVAIPLGPAGVNSNFYTRPTPTSPANKWPASMYATQTYTTTRSMWPSNMQANPNRVSGGMAGPMAMPVNPYGYVPPPGGPPMGPPPLTKWQKTKRWFTSDETKERFGKIGGVGALMAPMVAEHVFGTAEKPGMLGTQGARAGSVAGGVIAGAGVGMMAAGPWGALVGGLVAGAGALSNFNKQMKDIKFQELSDKFNKAISGIDEKTGKFNTEEDKKSFVGSIKELEQAQRSHENTYDMEAQNKFRKENINPFLTQVIDKQKAFITTHPNKSISDMEKEMPEVSSFIMKHASQGDLDTITKYKNQINKSTKAQADLDVAFGQLYVAAEGLSKVIEHTVGETEKSFARSDILRSGKISGGSDFENIGSLGGIGKELQDFHKVGGGMDQSKALIGETLNQINKKGIGPTGNVGQSLEDALKDNKLFQGRIGKFVLQSATTGLEGAVADPANFTKNLEAASKEIDKLRPLTDKMNQDLAKFGQMFAQSAVAIGEKQVEHADAQEKLDQFSITARKGRTEAMLAGNDMHFFGRNGIVTPQDQMAELNSRYAAESFQAQQRKFGVGADVANDPKAIAASLRKAQAELEALSAQRTKDVNSGKIMDGSDSSLAFKDATKKVNDLKGALSNLANSTITLESAQDRLKIALEKEAGDKAARKSFGEALAFGSDEERQKLLHANYLTSLAQQQGGVGNATEEERATIGDYLQKFGGAALGPNGLTGNQLKEQFADPFTPQSNLPMRRGVINGIPIEKTVGVINASAEVEKRQRIMAEAGQAAQGFSQEQIDKQVKTHQDEFAKGLSTFMQGIAATLETKPGELAAKVKDGGNELVNVLAGITQRMRVVLDDVKKMNVFIKEERKVANPDTLETEILARKRERERFLPRPEDRPMSPMAAGGMAKGTDTVPAMLTPGEFIVSKGPAQKNRKLLQEINSGAKMMAKGGFAEEREAEELRAAAIRKRRTQEVLEEIHKKTIQKQMDEGAWKNGDDDNPAIARNMEKNRDFQALQNRQLSPDQTNQFNIDKAKKLKDMSDMIQNKNLDRGPIEQAPSLLSKPQQAMKAGALRRMRNSQIPRARRQEMIGQLNNPMSAFYNPPQAQGEVDGAAPENAPAPLSSKVVEAQNNAMKRSMRNLQISPQRRKQILSGMEQRLNAATAQENGGGGLRSVPPAPPGGPAGATGGTGDADSAIKQMMEQTRPLIDALNNFPREISIKREGTVQVILNGADIVAKMKGDLEREVWEKIITTIQREVPPAVKAMAAG
jgi:hypothetical protein